MPPEEARDIASDVGLQLHASAVSVANRAVVIQGASGSGKSALAMQLLAYGAALIADDRTDIRARKGWPIAACPTTILGRIEARGIGILTAHPASPAPVVLIVQMDIVETDRLPPRRDTLLLGRRIRLLHKVESVHFAPAIFQYLKMIEPGTPDP